MNKPFYITIVVVILIIAGAIFYSVQSNKNKPNYDLFAKCLTEKGATMYGAEWCAHCKAEKDRFGSSFQYVNYVECPENAVLCTEKGIQGFPSWIINGQTYEGEQGLQRLSDLTSCALPVI